MGAPRQSLAPRRPGRPHTPLPNTAPRGHLNHAEAQGDLRRTPPQGGRRCRAHRPPRGGARGLRPRRGAKKAAPPPPGQPQPVARRPRRGAVAGWSAPSPGRRQCAVKRRRATPQKRRASSGAARVGFYHPARRQTPLKGFKMSGGRGGRSRRRHAATWFTPPPSTVEVLVQIQLSFNWFLIYAPLTHALRQGDYRVTQARGARGCARGRVSGSTY